MAIPADDPRLNPVRIDPARKGLESYERDEEGRILFDDRAALSEFLFVEPLRQRYDDEALRDTLDVSISELADENQEVDVTTTTIG